MNLVSLKSKLNVAVGITDAITRRLCCCLHRSFPVLWVCHRAWQGYDKLKTAMIAGNKIDVLVWAKFPTEAFHMEIYQELGAYGEQDGAVRVGGVMPGELNSCRKY